MCDPWRRGTLLCAGADGDRRARDGVGRGAEVAPGALPPLRSPAGDGLPRRSRALPAPLRSEVGRRADLATALRRGRRQRGDHRFEGWLREAPRLVSQPESTPGRAGRVAQRGAQRASARGGGRRARAAVEEGGESVARLRALPAPGTGPEDPGGRAGAPGLSRFFEIDELRYAADSPVGG